MERCFGHSLYAPKELAMMEQRDCTGNHLGCHLWFTRGEPSPNKPVSADAQRLFQQAEEQAKRNRATYVTVSYTHLVSWRRFDKTHRQAEHRKGNGFLSGAL